MKLNTAMAERAGWVAFVVVAGCTGLFWPKSHSDKTTAHAPTNEHHEHGGPSKADLDRVLAIHQGKPQLPPCRPGAFVEASNMINTIVQVSTSLPANTKPLIFADLDSLLYTALKQAQSEVHCITGGLTKGYDNSYAQSIERGVQLAQSRGLSNDIVKLGKTVAIKLRENRMIAAPI
jgi:hypothetical protein